MGRQAEGPGPAWRALGLAAAILSSCFLLTQAQEISIMVEPSLPLEGQDVTLTPGGKSNLFICVWYRGQETEADRIFTYTPSPLKEWRGTEFTGRETIGPGCSLHIKSLMLNYTGTYVVFKALTDSTERGHVELVVLVADPLSAAQEIPVMTYPSQLVKGQELTLTPGGNPNFAMCIWYREEQAEANRILTFARSSHHQHPGRNFTGREIGGLGCFLRIRSLMLNDTGNYVVSKFVNGRVETGHVEIQVLARHVKDKGVIAGITVGALAGAVLIGGLF